MIVFEPLLTVNKPYVFVFFTILDNKKLSKMRTLKIALVALATTLATSLYSQEKIEQKAAEQTKEFNLKLGEQKLNAEQEKQVTAIYVEKLKEMKELNKNQPTDEQKKEVHKKYSKQISELLTKEQKAALKEYNEKNKKN